MKHRTEDHEISRLLRDLPRETAPPGFTRDVLRRLDEPRPERRTATRTTWKLAAAAAVLALAVGLGVVLGLDLWPHSEPTRPAVSPSGSPVTAQARLEELRDEHRRLAQEMEELRELIRDDEPFVYLGGDEHVEFVYGIEPAVHRNAY